MPRKKKKDITVEQVMCDIVKHVKKIDNDILLYDGKNGIEIMNFCKAYHMECKNGPITLWIMKDGIAPIAPLTIMPGQLLVKENDDFKVVNNG